MSVPMEYLPASGGARQNLVLLHGWGGDRGVWRPLLSQLRSWANVTLLDIPGCAPGLDVPDDRDLTERLNELLEACPDRAVFIGHSLGGKLALELARVAPQRVAAVVTVCANPRFVADRGWPGMDPALFDEFRRSVEKNPAAALRRFESLQAQGAHQPRHLLRELRELRAARPGRALLDGLQWLERLDQREMIGTLAQPQLHVLGSADALVPAALADTLSAAGQARCRVITGSHLLPLEAPQQIADELREFLQEHALLLEPRESEVAIAKEEMAQSFSRAASSYDSAAVLQRDVGARLLDRLPRALADSAAVLDLGCGTGYFAAALQANYPHADYIGLDIADGMVRVARDRVAGEMWLVGDGEEMPLACASVDLVFSSLAVQWCSRPGRLFAEIARVLKPGGRCVFTTLGPRTLHELRAAWAAVDSHTHVNGFTPAAELQEAADGIADLSLALDVDTIEMQYGTVRELFDELKGIGAHNMNRQRRVGLTSRRALQGMLGAYEQWRRDGMLPATYEVLFGELEKA